MNPTKQAIVTFINENFYVANALDTSDRVSLRDLGIILVVDLTGNRRRTYEACFLVSWEPANGLGRESAAFPDPPGVQLNFRLTQKRRIPADRKLGCFGPLAHC